MFGDLRTNTRGWDIKTFDELSYLITDGEHAIPKRATEGIYLLFARNILNHSLQLTDVDYVDQEEYDRIAKRVVPQEGDVLISCFGTVGRCCSVPANTKFQMVRSVALIRFKEEVKPAFAEYMITSDYLQGQINSSKTTSSQANLFQGKIKALKGFVPPIDLQNQFADFVRQDDK
jgi:type I restriction enzyme S subunit